MTVLYVSDPGATDFYDEVAGVALMLPTGWRGPINRGGMVTGPDGKTFWVIGPTGRWVTKDNPAHYGSLTAIARHEYGAMHGITLKEITL